MYSYFITCKVPIYFLQVKSLIIEYNLSYSLFYNQLENA